MLEVTKLRLASIIFIGMHLATRIQLFQLFYQYEEIAIPFHTKKWTESFRLWHLQQWTDLFYGVDEGSPAIR